MITSIVLPLLVVQFFSENCVAGKFISHLVRNKRDLEGFDMFGTSRNDMINALFDNHNIAMRSAQSAVTSSIGQVYGNQQAALAHSVQQFMIPMEKQKMIHAVTMAKTNLPSSFISTAGSDSHWSNPEAIKIEKFTPQESKPSSAHERAQTQKTEKSLPKKDNEKPVSEHEK